MKASVFLAHNQKGYICEVFFDKKDLTGRLLAFIHDDAEQRNARGFLPQLQKYINSPADMANAYGQYLQKFSKDHMKITILDADVIDPQNFKAEAP